MAIKKKERLKKTLHATPKNKFKNLAEKSIAGIYLIQNWVFKYVNPKFSEIFEYSVDEVINKMGPKDVVMPDDWPTVEENINKRISGEIDAIHYEFRGITKTNRQIFIEVYGTRTLYRGRPAVIGTLLDITKRKHAEELLKQTEEKYRGIFENAIEGIFQITPEGKFISANPALKKMLGYDSTDELADILKDMGIRLFVDQKKRFEFYFTLENKGLIKGFECELHKRDKSTIWVSMNVRAVRDNNDKTLYYEGTVEDITERKISESELKRLNEFNKAIIENAPIAIFTLNRDGVFTSVNPALAIISGLNEEAEKVLLGFNWLKNAYTIKCGLAEYIKKGLNGEPFQLTDFPYMTYRGDRSLYMDFKGVPLMNKDGDVEGLLCIIEETTERVKTTARLMQEAKMAAIGKLAAGIAHELNNPLATLVAHSELALKWLKSLQTKIEHCPEMDKLTDCLDVIQTEAFRCKTVTSDILSLPWKEGFEKVEIDLNSLLNDIIKFQKIDRWDGKIVTDFYPCLPRVTGDVVALRQVFLNLITNAMDAIEKRLDGTIWIRTKHLDTYIQVEVEDNGEGIPVPIIEKIFEPFFTTKEPKKGIGLGLALCHELINSLGGKITVKSNPGNGTIFYVRFPINPFIKERIG